jgi:hypothetical protein
MAKTKKAKTATKTEAPKVERVEQPKANGVTRPREGTMTGRVWEIADAISEKTGEPARRAEVLEQYTEEGGNASTGATQYGRWRKFYGLGRDATKPRPKQEDEAPEAEAEDAPEAEVDAEDELEDDELEVEDEDEDED